MEGTEERSAPTDVRVGVVMRNTTTFKELIANFLEGSTEGNSATGTLKIREDQLIHYYTPIMERYTDKMIINVSRYSLVTGRLQKQILEIVPKDVQVIVKRVPENYKGSLKDFIRTGE